ncbi:hypothetical protein FHR74_000490 [Sphingomonas aerolata]|nr:hypothetical protein [Sphingomonas aerolata]
MLEARGDEDGDGADDHGDLARQRSGEHRHPHGQTDQHVRQDTRCQRRERRLVQLRIHRSGCSVADRSRRLGSTSITMRWAGQHSLPDLVLRSRVLGRGNLGRRRHPVRAGSQSPHDQRSLRKRPRGNTVKPLRTASPIMCCAKTMPAKNDRFSMGQGQFDMNILAAVIDGFARAPSFLLSPVAMIGNSSSLSHRPLVPIPQYIR